LPYYFDNLLQNNKKYRVPHFLFFAFSEQIVYNVWHYICRMGYEKEQPFN